MWLYGQGFPKSLDVSKAIDKYLGAKREQVAPRSVIAHQRSIGNTRPYMSDPNHQTDSDVPATQQPAAWDGWGTALKPAHEPIVVARKPLISTVADNVLSFGTGALNIGACRVGDDPIPSNKLEQWSGFGELKRPDYTQTMHEGRWPANVIHDRSEEVLAGFPDAPGQLANVSYGDGCKTSNVFGAMKRGNELGAEKVYSDSGATTFALKPGARRLDRGSAARFFYCAKANKIDRNEGCEGIEPRFSPTMGNGIGGKEHDPETATPKLNHRPTVKPTELMRYLCRLVTPPGGIVLDPFMGSGSTGKAAMLEGFDFIGIDMNQEYVALSGLRIGFVTQRQQQVPCGDDNKKGDSSM